MSLYLGGEIFDVMVQPMQLDNHLFVRQGAGLQGHAVFKQVSVLSFLPKSMLAEQKICFDFLSEMIRIQ